MMGLARRVASGWLRLLTGLAPAESRDWGRGMLAEVEHLDSDRAAIGWAFGASLAIIRHSLAHAHPLRRVLAASSPHRMRLAMLVIAITLMIAMLAWKHGRSVSESRPASAMVSR